MHGIQSLQPAAFYKPLTKSTLMALAPGSCRAPVFCVSWARRPARLSMQAGRRNHLSCRVLAEELVSHL